MAGSSRFGRLIGAVRKGQNVPPVDMRYLRKGVPTRGNRGGDDCRGRVVSFLRGIYESVAETLPDGVRDECNEDDVGCMAVTLPQDDPDPYAEAVGDPTSLKPKKKKAVRSVKSGVKMNVSRRPEFGYEKRWLPPGHIRDYYEQFVSIDRPAGDGKQVSFATFWRVWHEEFGAILQFRATSSHAICSTCVRHKLLIKNFAGHMRARQAQVEHLANHLKSQYLDRLCYWDLRAQSRIRCTLEILIILDGMDQNKFLYPRSDLFRSKELATMNRLKAHITGAILHGRAIFFWVSPADVKKDANSCIECVAFCLNELSKELDLSKVVLNLQSDNTSREVKNNHMLRFLSALTVHGALVGRGLIASSLFSCVDVDALASRAFCSGIFSHLMFFQSEICRLTDSCFQD